jgi:hypothetical protein
VVRSEMDLGGDQDDDSEDSDLFRLDNQDEDDLEAIRRNRES